MTGVGSLWHSWLLDIGGDDAYVIASIVLFVSAFLVPMLITSNSKGYGVFHKNHLEINMGLGKKNRTIEYSAIKRVTEGFNSTGFNWLIEVDGGRNIFIGLTIWPKHNKALRYFMETLKQKAPKIKT